MAFFARSCSISYASTVPVAPSPYVDNLLPLPPLAHCQINCMEDGLPVIDSAFRRKSDHDILVQKCRIVGGSFYVIAPGKYFPWTSADKALSRRRRKCLFQPFVIHC